MKTEIFTYLPKEAIEIRKKVFICEQGFCVEFDDLDNISIHFIVFDDSGLPVSTCRIFKDDKTGKYIFGRLAVLKEYRGKKIGALTVTMAEEYIKSIGGNEIRLHAQCQASKFYEKLGFHSFGNVEYEEHCPHIWMKKAL